jgi:hypothetical protein
MRTLLVLAGAFALLVLAILLAGIAWSQPEIAEAPGEAAASYADKQGDEELAYLLVKLVLRTRTVIAGHYTRAQSKVPGVDQLYARWMAKNAVLPAAVADQVFSEVVPGVTGGRAWVKMVVETPRNPHNRGDDVALELLRDVQRGAKSAERSTGDAYYYGEPIQAKAWCLRCHGEPAGDPDPLFAQYTLDGWREGDIIGAVIARVAARG